MKKIMLSVAFLTLGGGYFANAQVGIGTPTPATSTLLEVFSKDGNKGVLIPRVSLGGTTQFSPITGTEIESLLVYNTATAGDVAAKTNVTPGFYYWVDKNGAVNAHWERIVNQSQLDEAIGNITNIQADLDKVLALLKVAFPSNNLVNPAVTGDTHGGGMVFTPGDNTATPVVAPKIEYVYFDGTTQTYIKKDITADIINLIKGAESKTTILEFPAASGKFYYISEETIQANNGAVPTTPFSTGTTLRTGVVYLDVPESVIKNFKTILDGTTTINKPGSTTEFYTVEEYIKYLSSTVDGNVIYKNIAATGNPANFVFQYWDTSVTPAVYKTINLGDIVKANESKTLLITTTDKAKQYYISETYLSTNAAPTQAIVDGWATAPAGVYQIEVVDGVVNNFETILDGTTTIVKPGTTNDYYTVEEYIKYLSSTVEGNVIYKNIGTSTTPNWVFQYWNGTTYTTINLTDLVGAAQSKTLLVKTNTANAAVKQYYLSETFIVANTTNGVYTAPTQTAINGWTVATLPAGVYEIDIVEGVSTNFETILDRTTTIEKSTGVYYTVQDYIEYISKNSMQDGVTKIVLDNTVTPVQASFQMWNSTTNSWTSVDNTAFSTIVKANETRTSLARSENNAAYAEVTVDPKGTTKVTYEYTPETGNKNYIDVTADILYSINNNEEVKKAITKFLSSGGNVYYTKDAIAADAATGQVAIPANSLFIIEIVGGEEVKTPIDISGTVLQVITNNSQDIKNILGDKINKTTVVKTGDTFNGGDVYIYTNTTTIAANSAVTSGITIPAGIKPGAIIGIKVIDSKGISANVTDVVVTAQSIAFNIGTGNMYNILGAGTYDVIVEFVGTVTP